MYVLSLQHYSRKVNPDMLRLVSLNVNYRGYIYNLVFTRVYSRSY